MSDMELGGIKKYILVKGLDAINYKNSQERLAALIKITEGFIELEKALENTERK